MCRDAPRGGGARAHGWNITLTWFLFFSPFCDPKFCSPPEAKPQSRFFTLFDSLDVNHLKCVAASQVPWKTQNQKFCSSHTHKTGYCIHREIELQNVSLYAYFLPQKNSQKKGREEAFSSQTAIILKLTYLQNYNADSNQTLHSDKDHQVLFVGGPNTRSINPRWRRPPSWKKR